MSMLANLIEFHTDDPRYENIRRQWTGVGNLNFDGFVWHGMGNILSISPSTNSVQQPTNRMTVSFVVRNNRTMHRLLTLTDALMITTQWIFSSDEGQTWAASGLKYTGRLSGPRIANGVYSVELETFRGSAQKGRLFKWSEQSQLNRHPGDKCFEYLRRIEVGVESKWG